MPAKSEHLTLFHSPGRSYINYEYIVFNNDNNKARMLALSRKNE